MKHAKGISLGSIKFSYNFSQIKTDSDKNNIWNNR